MGLIAKETGNGSGIPPIAPGMYQAVCVGIYDMGSTMSEKWKKLQHKVCIVLHQDVSDICLDVPRGRR